MLYTLNTSTMNCSYCLYRLLENFDVDRSTMDNDSVIYIYEMGFPGGSAGKEFVSMQETWVYFTYTKWLEKNKITFDTPSIML